jgi:3'(2'), 5'-bisphosphate nucleotidase
MRKLDYEQLLEDIAIAAAEAGEAILKIVEGGFAVESKDDLSPVTIADRAAELIILPALAKAAPGVPVVAEEEVAAGRIPDFDDFYFLVDPLDGTREFVRGGEDYTVNIGLLSGNSPLLGVVFAPALGTIYGGTAGKGAWIEDSRGRRPIRARERGQKIAAVASKSHFNQPTADYLADAVGECDYVGIGSSLKFCVVARGDADIYPRLSPTSEWDTAAGHAVLLAAGGIVDGPDGTPLRYGKDAFINRGFVATSGWTAPPIEPFLRPFSGGGDLPQGV